MSLRLPLFAVGLAIGVGAQAAPAAAELQAGGWLGARIYSDNALLGQVAGAPVDTSLVNGVVFGGRLAFPVPRITRVVVPEVELPLSITSVARFGGTVLWTAPRAHLRLELQPGEKWAPFLVVGGGASIALSSTDVYATSIQGHGYVGMGVALRFRSRVHLRADARLVVEAGVDPAVALEGEVTFGVSMPIGGPRRASGGTSTAAVADRDGDGLGDAEDTCPTRAEDKDEFEDADGCPDIDNDGDRALDDADRCPLVPEALNGFDDDDGCPDVLPPEVEALLGPIAGLTFAAEAATLPKGAARALEPIVALLAAQPSIKVILVGHAGEGDVATEVDDDGQPIDPEPMAQLLGIERARAVHAALVAQGVALGRLAVEGRGLGEPISTGGSAKEQAKNRRVDVRLFVPTR